MSGAFKVIHIGEPSVTETARCASHLDTSLHVGGLAARPFREIRFQGLAMQGHEALHPFHKIPARHISAAARR